MPLDSAWSVSAVPDKILRERAHNPDMLDSLIFLMIGHMQCVWFTFNCSMDSAKINKDASHFSAKAIFSITSLTLLQLLIEMDIYVYI